MLAQQLPADVAAVIAQLRQHIERKDRELQRKADEFARLTGADASFRGLMDVLFDAPEDDPGALPDSFAQVAVAGADEYVLHLLRVDGRVRYSLCYRYDMG